MIGKDGTGPNLNGIKQKWNDAGEGDYLYEWVKNPATLIATGKVKWRQKQKILVRQT